MNANEALKLLLNNTTLKPNVKKDCEKVLMPILNKQVPVKVHDNDLLANSTSVWLCPICKSFIAKHDSYCGVCGQTLNWK